MSQIEQHVEDFARAMALSEGTANAALTYLVSRGWSADLSYVEFCKGEAAIERGGACLQCDEPWVGDTLTHKDGCRHLAARNEGARYLR